MKKLLVATAGSAALLLSCVSAFAIESDYKASSNQSADAVWAKIGDFCGIGNWHPAVAKCEISENNALRTLSLKGGGTIQERLLNWDAANHNYTYHIVSSPLPITDYFSTISVIPAGSGSEIEWKGYYNAAKGTSDDAAKKILDGIYKAGVDNLAK